MNNTILYILWAAMYVICGVLGVHPIPGWVGILACIGFFVPPAVLLWRRDGKNLQLIRNLSLLWLGLTLILLILNILTVAMSAAAGDVLYYILVLVSSPMVCGGYWVIALFGWACLLMTSLKLLKK